MLDSYEEDRTEHTREWVAKLAAFFAILLVVSFGLCGLTGVSSFVLERFAFPLAMLEAAGVVVGAGGLLLTGVAAVVLALAGAFRR